MSKQLQSDLSDIQSLVGLNSPQRQALMDAAVAREIDRQNRSNAAVPSSSAKPSAPSVPLRKIDIHHCLAAQPSSKFHEIPTSAALPLRQKKLDDEGKYNDKASQPPLPTLEAQPPAKPKPASEACKPTKPTTPLVTSKKSSAEAARTAGRRYNRVYNSTGFRFIDYKSALAFLKSPERTNGGAWINPAKSGKHDRRFLCGQPGHLEAGCRAASIIKPVFSDPPTIDGANKPVAAYYEVMYSTDEHKEPPPKGIVTDEHKELPPSGIATTDAVAVAVDESISGGKGKGRDKGKIAPSPQVQSANDIVPEVRKCMEELLKCNDPEAVRKLLQKQYVHDPSIKLPTLEQIQSLSSRQKSTINTKRAKTSS